MKYHRGDPLRHVGDVPSMGADRYGGALAFEYRGDEYSYAELETRSNRAANALVKAGIEPGDRVALYLENSLQFPESFFGIIKAGAVAVPLNHRMDRERLRYVLGDSGAVALITSPVFPQRRHRPRRGRAARVHPRRRRGPRGLRRARRRRVPGVRPARPCVRRRRRPAVHLGHDRRPEGRADDPSE